MKNLHHLLLIEHYTVGFDKLFFHDLMFVHGLLVAVLCLDVFFNQATLYRVRTIESIYGCDFSEVGGLQPPQQFANAAAFQLENALGLATADHCKCLFVVERELVRIKLLAGCLLDPIDHLPGGS